MILLSWRSFWFVLASVALSAPPRPALGSEVECDPEHPKRCSTGLQEGQKAPYAGQLLTPELALFLGGAAEDCPDRIRVEVQKATGDLEIDLALAKRLREIDQEGCTAKLEAVQTEESLLEQVLTHPALWFVVGVAATVGAYQLASMHIQGVGR